MDPLPQKSQNRLFSIGYVAKGVVYILVGFLTLATVLGFSAGSGGIDGPQSVLKWVAEQPLGRMLVGMLSTGLFAYAIWRIYRGFVDPHDKGHDVQSSIKRIGYVASGVANGALGAVALNLALSGPSSSSSRSSNRTQGIIADLLSAEWGVWLVGLLGVAVIGVGVYQVIKAVRADFLDKVHWRVLSRDTVKALGRWGFFARGLVFGIIGYFLIMAAVNSNAQAFRGTSGALAWLNSHSYGLVLLGITSAGLLLYGVFSVLKGRYSSVYQQS